MRKREWMARVKYVCNRKKNRSATNGATKKTILFIMLNENYSTIILISRSSKRYCILYQ
jgi:hypothetical protein